MITVDFPPPHISVAFDPTNSFFGAFGDSGNYINIYDTVNYWRTNVVTIKKDIGKCFLFSPSRLELVVATTSCKIKFYDLREKDCSVPTREISNIHRDSINSLNFSKNGLYLMTTGDDKTIKILDSDIDKISPYFFQSFIGHTFAVKKAFFNPNNNNQCISVGGKDGIHLWKFYGYVNKITELDDELKLLKKHTKERLGIYDAPELQPQPTVDQIQPQPQQEGEIEAEGEDGKQELGDVAEHVSDDKIDEIQEKENIDSNVQQETSPDGKLQDGLKNYQEYKEADLAEGESPAVEGEETEGEHAEGDVEGEREDTQEVERQPEEPLRYNYSGKDAQDNIIWLREKSFLIFTSQNDIILEDMHTKVQTVIEDGHETYISALSISPDGRYLASSSLQADSQGSAPIIIWDVSQDFAKKYELRSHELGIKSILFSQDGQYLVSLGSNEERSLVIWDVEEGLAMKSAMCPVPYSGIALLEPQDCKLMLATVGKESYRLWKIENDNELLF